jgi:hypothetical protein
MSRLNIYFESIHPFEDGNRRIGRAIAEKALSQGIGRPVMLSLSKTIESNLNQRPSDPLGNGCANSSGGGRSTSYSINL